MDECRDMLAGVGLEIERVYPAGLVHLPRVDLPHAVYRAADRLASTSAMLTAVSESPIIVARRHGVVQRPRTLREQSQQPV